MSSRHTKHAQLYDLTDMYDFGIPETAETMNTIYVVQKQIGDLWYSLPHTISKTREQAEVHLEGYNTMLINGKPDGNYRIVVH